MEQLKIKRSMEKEKKEFKIEWANLNKVCPTHYFKEFITSSELEATLSALEDEAPIHIITYKRENCAWKKLEETEIL